MTQTAATISIDSSAHSRRSQGVIRRLFSQPSAVVAASLLTLLVFLAIFSPELFGSPTAQHVDDILAAPSWHHPFGTDELGRDLLTRVAYGGRLSMGIGLGATAISLVLGAAWGLAAASAGGWIEEILMRIVDSMLAIPLTLFALVCVAAFGVSLLSLTVIIGILMTPLSARVMRAAVLAELKTDYVRALTAVGVPRTRVMTREVLPNAIPSLMAQTTLNVAIAVLLEASLSFLGVGLQPPAASWGTLIAAGYAQLFSAPWYPIFPGVAILLAIGSINTLGTSLQRVIYRSGS